MGGDGDGWVDCNCGRRHWGLHGAAGLLILKEGAVLLQHRSPSSHNGSTWGLPGGARDSGETAEEAALREAHEEAGIQSELVDIHLVHAENHGNWAYDTVIATGRVGLSAYAANHESLEVKWVPLSEVSQFDLHPSFAKAWPELLRKIVELLAI